MMNFTRLSGLDDDTNLRTLARGHEVMVHGATGDERAYRHALR